MITPFPNSVARSRTSPRGPARESVRTSDGWSAVRTGDVWRVTDVAPIALPYGGQDSRVGKVEAGDWELVTVVSAFWTAAPGAEVWVDDSFHRVRELVWTVIVPRFGLCGFRDDWFGSDAAHLWRRVDR